MKEPEAELRSTYELRYRGQAFELAIAAATEPQVDELRAAFESEHEDRYGYYDSEQELELVTIRVTATLEASELELVAGDDHQAPERGSRNASLGGSDIELEACRGAPPPGTRIHGPAIVALAAAT